MRAAAQVADLGGDLGGQLNVDAAASLGDRDVDSGEVDEAGLRQLAPSLRLGAEALVVSARKAWYPQQHKLPGFAQFNTPFEDMTVNAYLAWDDATKEAVAFDTGAT